MASFVRHRHRNKNKVNLFGNYQKEVKVEVVSKACDLKINKEALYFLPLGGSGEFGLNLNMYCCDGKWLIVDLGVSFDGTASINVFMPNINFIKSIPPEDIVGILITHGHEDHLGAVQYLWQFIKRPVYATPFTISLLKRKIIDMKAKPYSKHHSDLIEIDLKKNNGEVSQTIELGPFKVQWASVTHSIPDNSMIMIRTKYGNVLHTGDWRFDPEPVVGDRSDIEALTKFGAEGVLAVIGDSTNAMTPGKFASESDVKETLEQKIAKITSGRVVVVCFSTNVSRVDSCARIAQKVNRKVCLVGRSLSRIRDVSLENGYLQGVPEFINEDAAQNCPRDELFIVCTGSQGEPNSGLRRLSDNEHPKIKLEPGDTVIISARMITGKERDINNMINNLVRMGVKVETTDQDADIHVSGHPPQEDLKTLYNIIKPAIGVPVHGEIRNLLAHRDLFRSLGIKSELIENGDMMHLSKTDYKRVAKIEVGQLGLDGIKLIPKDGTVLMERAWLATGGCIIVNVKPRGNEITLFGVCEHSDHRFKAELSEALDGIIRKLADQDIEANSKAIIANLRKGINEFVYTKRGIDPKIFIFLHGLPAKLKEMGTNTD